MARKKFEVAVYNSEVRRLVKEGKRHRDLKDEWADTHYIEIQADDMQSARAKIANRYPENRGYVIEHVMPLSE